MAENIQYSSLEWLNENMHRNYPIMDDTIPVSIEGSMLPSTVLVDLSISCVGKGVNRNGFYVSHVHRLGSGIQVVISYMNDKTPIICAMTPVIPITIHAGLSVADRTFNLFPIDKSNIEDQDSLTELEKALSTVSGLVIIGSCIDMINAGTYQLLYANGKIMPTLVHVYSTGLERITFLDADGTPIASWTDDFTLQAGDGIEFSTEGDDVLVISRTATKAELGADYKNITDVVTKLEELIGTPIRSINGITPSDGDISILGGDCTKVETVGSGIVISNPCSVPCCSSSDITDVSAALQSLEDAKTRLMNYYTAITTNINAIQARLSSLIASRG